MSRGYYPPARGTDERPPAYNEYSMPSDTSGYTMPTDTAGRPYDNPPQAHGGGAPYDMIGQPDPTSGGGYPYDNQGYSHQDNMASYGASVPYYPPPQRGGGGGMPPQQPGGVAAVAYNSGGNVMTVYPSPVDQQPHPNLPPVTSSGSDDGGQFTSSFSEKKIRHAFVKKVFGILAVQLLITGAIVSVFFFSETVKEFNEDHIWIWLAALIVSIGMIIVLSCVSNVRRQFPANIICLIVFTIAEACLIGSTAAHYDTDEVLMAMGIVIAIVIAMSILGMQQKIDFTPMVGGLTICLMALLGFGLLCVIYQGRYMSLIYATLGAILFSLWLLVDIQLIMGGKRKYTVNPEEYIFAALNLYLDILLIFLFILMCFGGGD